MLWSFLITTVCFFGLNLLIRNSEKSAPPVLKTLCSAIIFGIIVTATDYVRLKYFGKGHRDPRARFRAVLAIVVLVAACFGILALVYRP